MMRHRLIPWGKTMTDVSAATIFENIYKNFYDLLVAITGFSTIVYPVFPDLQKKDTSEYPIVILNSPELEWNKFTFGKNVVNGTIRVDIYQKTPKDADSYASDVSYKIETSKTTLAGVGLREINMDSSDTDVILQGKIKIFVKSLVFSYKFYFNKTFSY